MGLLGALSVSACASGGADPAALGDGDGASSPEASGTATAPSIDATTRALDAGHDAGPRFDASSDASSDSGPVIGPDAPLGGNDAAEDAVADATVVDATAGDAAVADSGVADAHDGGNAVACGGLNEWFAGTTDSEVKHFGEKYTCLVAGWCSQSTSNAVLYYEPGKGLAWTDAWKDSGPCPP